MFHIAVNLFQYPYTVISQHFHCYRSGENNGRGELISWIICCVTQPVSMLLLQIDGAQHFDPRGSWRLTHSCAVMESASHHSNPNAEAHFHGLAEKLPSKQGNHTCSLECSSIFDSPATGGPLPSYALGKDRPENPGGETSLQVQSSGRKLLHSGSSNLNNCTLKEWPVWTSSALQ